MTARLWTKGWDFFAPGINIIYHLWERTHRPNFRELPDTKEAEARSQRRAKFILGMIEKSQVEEEALVEIEKYGIPQDSQRSLEDYQKFSGVNFKDGTIQEKAFYSGQPKTIFMDYLLEMIYGTMNAIKK
eukprot:TRINITY_DN7046_c0_g1_i3.p2 TRINITY_DN7046_c0_g1~~TRINITY_DN7046_c0_g1_i3.p2  ORF type:complete len:130 (+),score=38.26 TRINITY_DN7046_c0_g1_i3:696-1085(+)